MALPRILALLICLSSLATASSDTARLFWTDKDAGRLEASDLDGSNRITILPSIADPRGIVFDPIRNRLYWASHQPNGAIFSINCDGSDQVTLVSSLDEPADLALDVDNGFLYWAEQGSNQIRRQSLLSSTTPETVLDGLNQPYYLTIDSAAGHVYWSDFNSSVIHRANVDGTGSTNIITGQSRVRDVEIADGFLYWCDRNSRQIRRRAIDGTGGGSVLFSGLMDSLNRPHGLVLEPTSGTMYWTDTTTDEVNAAAMDGSGNVTTLISTSLIGAWGITLVPPANSGESSYETWSRQYFSAEDLADTSKEDSLWGEAADPDADGLSNLYEFAQGTDPLSPRSDPAVFRAQTVALGEDLALQITFRFRKDEPDLTFTIESSERLTPDSWLSDRFTEVPPRTDDPAQADYEFIQFRSGVITDSQRKMFARLRVSR